MSPSLVLIAWFVLLMALLRLDPARRSNTSLALWVPVIWMFIVGSRLPSQWVNGPVGVQTIQALEEGNPLDRVVYVVLILLAIGILTSRAFGWGSLFAQNQALTALVFFGLLSVSWSDYPFVAFKHWFRDLGNYLVIFVALSDARPLDAVITVLRRVCYLLIPLSILLIKYYPQLGKQYEAWSGAAMYIGAATSKNMLGVMCLVSGIFFFWDVMNRWPARKERHTRRVLVIDVAFLAMTLWLLIGANSATARVCLILGCLIIAMAQSKTLRRHPAFLRRMVPIFIVLSVVLTLALNINAQLAQAIGRDPTLTGRTDIWKAVLNVHTNPLVGAGYESFWLGPRVTKVWNQTGAGINEAHNGYLEIYLNEGLVGLFLLIAFLIASYRSICKMLKSSPSVGSLSLAVWTVLPFYNITESAFKGQLMLALFLSGAIAVRGARPLTLRKSPSLDDVTSTVREVLAP